VDFAVSLIVAFEIDAADGDGPTHDRRLPDSRTDSLPPPVNFTYTPYVYGDDSRGRDGNPVARD
jgi:hypothetical protein